jgi:hypothetical protein
MSDKPWIIGQFEIVPVPAGHFYIRREQEPRSLAELEERRFQRRAAEKAAVCNALGRSD